MDGLLGHENANSALRFVAQDTSEDKCVHKLIRKFRRQLRVRLYMRRQQRGGKTNLVRVWRGDEEDGACLGNLPGAAWMDLPEEQIHQETHYPYEQIILPRD